jgi:NodT family efflux transporter outer membrane factor (OMF) lipoprotein
MTRWRAQAGLASSLDVQQAVSSYEQQRAQIPLLESNLAQGMNRLAVLTGEAPGAVSDQLMPRRAVPVAPLDIAAGVPADVLRRRPDIRRAERQLAAQTAQVGVATAALYPSLSLSGSITLQSPTASDVLDGWRTERAALSLSMPLFRGGALRQAVKVQDALVDAALANYEATVLAAYEEVENALDAWTNEQHRRGFLLNAVVGARNASALARMEYEAGLVDFQTVITVDRQLISLEDSLAVSDGEVTSNLIRLYKALGGGWSAFPQAASL